MGMTFLKLKDKFMCMYMYTMCFWVPMEAKGRCELKLQVAMSHPHRCWEQLQSFATCTLTTEPSAQPHPFSSQERLLLCSPILSCPLCIADWPWTQTHLPLPPRCYDNGTHHHASQICSRCPGTHYLSQPDCRLLILPLPQFPMCWDYGILLDTGNCILMYYHIKEKIHTV